MKDVSESLSEEAGAPRTRVLTAKMVTRIGYWNVRTLYQSTKLAQVIKEMEAYKIHILGLSEVRWLESGKFMSKNKTILFSGRQDNIHRDGVALILDKQAVSALEEWTPVNERLLTARFITAHAKVTVIQCYAPPNDHDDDDKDAFYQQLQDLVEKVPRHDILLVMGDLNAQIGEDRSGFEDVLGPHGYGKRTDNGDRFVQFCAMNNMKVGSTLFEHKDIHRITWISNDHRTQTQIDHIAIGPKWRTPCLQDVRVYRGADVCSDHFLSIAKLQVKLKRPKKKEMKSRRYDTSKLKDPATQAEFQTFLSNRFSALAEPAPGSTEWWDQLKDAMSAAGSDILGFKRPLKECWIGDQTWTLIAERKELHRKRNTCSSDQVAYYQEYIEKDREVKRSAQRDKREWMDRQAEEAEEAAKRNDMRAVYQIAKKISGTVKTGSGPVKAKDGTLLSKGEDKLARWGEHFKEVLNRPEPPQPAETEDPPHQLPINTDDFTEEEVRKAIKTLKNNKSPGFDGITAEMLKGGGDCIVSWMRCLCNQVWNSGTVPEDWKNGEIVCIPKKGNLSDCDNWRGVTLLSIPGKVYCQVILNRLRDTVDSQLREEQAGFRPKRSCAEQIFTLRQIIEKCGEHQVPLAVSFIDFSKAFDSVHRPSLWKILEAYGIPKKCVSAIEQIYNNSKCRVRTEDGYSDWFEVLTGVRQGCILSPLLFAIAIDWVLRRATAGKGIQWIDEKQLADLDFADDIAALANNTQDLQLLVNEISSSAGNIGLIISAKKTKNMLSGEHPVHADVMIDQKKVEEVEDFTYLGSSISSTSDLDHELKCRVGKAAAAFNSLSKIWSSKKFSLTLKLRFYNSNVISTLLYGCETWQMKTSQEKKLDAFDTKCLRKILGIKWSDFVSNEEVRDRSQQPSVSTTICKRRLRWLGHVWRLPESRPANQALRWTPVGQRKRGRPKMNWRQTVERDLRLVNRRWSDTSRLAEDRARWRALTASCVERRGST